MELKLFRAALAVLALSSCAHSESMRMDVFFKPDFVDKDEAYACAYNAKDKAMYCFLLKDYIEELVRQGLAGAAKDSVNL